MPAKNPRVMVVMEQPLYYTVCRKAKRDGVSLSTEMRDLVRQALEDNEDIVWSQKADQRSVRRSKKTLVSHRVFWKRLGI